MRVLATVWCLACSTGKHKSKLGEVVEQPEWSKPYRLLWHATDQRFDRTIRGLVRAPRNGYTLTPTHPEWVFLGGTPPEELTAYCRRHGPVPFASADVIDKRGNVYV